MVQLLKEMEEYAKENNIPIMMDDGLKFIEDYIKKNNVKRTPTSRGLSNLVES